MLRIIINRMSLRRGGHHPHQLPDGLVEAPVGSVPEDLGLVLVLHEVLDVAHLVEDGGEVLEVVVSAAHPDPDILAVVEVPCGGVADHLPPVLPLPERARHTVHAEAGVEIVRSPEQCLTI